MKVCSISQERDSVIRRHREEKGVYSRRRLFESSSSSLEIHWLELTATVRSCLDLGKAKNLISHPHLLGLPAYLLHFLTSLQSITSGKSVWYFVGTISFSTIGYSRISCLCLCTMPLQRPHTGPSIAGSPHNSMQKSTLILPTFQMRKPRHREIK